MPTIKQNRGDILILMAMAMFGSYSLFLRLIPKLPTISFLFAFQIVGATGFLFIVKTRKERPALGKKTILLLVSLAATAILNDLFYFSAFRLTTIANAAFSHQMVSVFMLVLAPLFLGEKTRRHEWLALLISILGMFFLYQGGISLKDANHLVGITYGLISAVFYALLVILYRHLPTLGLSINTINAWRYSLSSLALFPFFAASGTLNLAPANLFALAAFGTFFAVIASGIHTYGISITKAIHATIIGKIEPVFAVIYAYVFLGEQPGLYAIIGGALIMVSSLWIALRKEKVE